jgi:glyoxylase-like metal-dependent hydrolase (beta-lactamase superfamily II)
MITALEFDPIQTGLSIWHGYDSAVKADLFSTAISTKDGIFLVDPIQLEKAALAQLLRKDPLAGIILTNNNHLRATDNYLRRFPVPFFAHRDSGSTAPPIHFNETTDEMMIGGELEVTAIDGAAPGEIALYHAADGGTLIIGDALINFEPYGFTFLPEKYCQDARQMRDSLQKLLPFKTERILFAHGMPILSGASDRLRQLLQTDL